MSGTNETCPAPEAGQGQRGVYIIPPVSRPVPSTGEPIRLLLGERASDALTAAGESAFVVIGKASLPDDPTRWVIHLLPLTMKTACDAIAVATGEARATRSRVKGPTAPEKPATATIDGNAGAPDG